MLVDGPRKLVVQLPGNEGEDEGCDGHENRVGNQLDANLLPDIVPGDEAVILEDCNSIVDLVELDAGIDENADIVKDKPDDLDGILLAQGIVYEDELVDEAEHEDGEVCGNGAGFVVVLRNVVAQARLELGKDVAARGG